jgi:protein TonB
MAMGLRNGATKLRGVAFPISLLAHVGLAAALLTASMRVVAPEAPRVPVPDVRWVPDVRADSGPAPAGRALVVEPRPPRRRIERAPGMPPPALPSLDGPLDPTFLDVPADVLFGDAVLAAVDAGEPGPGYGSTGGDADGIGPGAGPPGIRVGGRVQPPAKLRHVAPAYPELARRARQQGRVVLECTIDADGRVVDARVLRGVPLLDQAALDAVRQWVYAPTLLNGTPVPVVMSVTVTFVLE